MSDQRNHRDTDLDRVTGARHHLNVAVVGGGINGVMIAWRLAERGHAVQLFERDTLMSATSSASTKLLHGGLRYLENREIRLVYESLHERTWWVEQAPHLAHPIELLFPIRRTGSRPRWLVWLGLGVYDALAGRHTFGKHRWHTRQELATLAPKLRADDLVGAYSFFDAQMNDHALGLWAADKARAAGVQIHEHTMVERLATEGSLTANGALHSFDRLVNAAGPWAAALLAASGVGSVHSLDLVRGSHLVLPGSLPIGVLVEVPGERRVCFVLPYEGRILVGTTEVRQSLDESIVCSEAERRYLLNVYNSYFSDTRTDADILETFSGVRPLLRSAADPARASREYAVERDGALVTVFGGKWTTSRALARRVAEVVERG